MILQVKLKGLEVFCQIVLEFFKSAINRLIPTVNQTLSVEEIGEFSLKQLNFRWKWVGLTGSSQEYRLIGPGSRTGQVVMLRVVVSCVIVIENPRHQRIGTSVSSSARKCEAFCKQVDEKCARLQSSCRRRNAHPAALIMRAWLAYYQ